MKETSTVVKLCKLSCVTHSFGKNERPPRINLKLWKAVLKMLNSKINLLLATLACLSIVTGLLYSKQGWHEGTAIFVAILIFALTTALHLWHTDHKFLQMTMRVQDTDHCVVMRGNHA